MTLHREPDSGPWYWAPQLERHYDRAELEELSFEVLAELEFILCRYYPFCPHSGVVAT